jgi:acetyl esterase
MGIKLHFIHLMLKKNRKKIRKKEPWIGKRFLVPREKISDVETIIYYPKNTVEESLPVMFNVHGGAWVGGDASGLDTQSQQLADTLSCFVVNINYHKADEYAFPYCQNEVKDVVLYFAKHAQNYGIDKTKFTIIGYSAGGHICAGAAMLLRDEKFSLNSHVMCYPFLDFHTMGALLGGGEGEEKLSEKQKKKTEKLMEQMCFRSGIDRYSALMSPAGADIDELKELSPAELIICGPDALYQQALDYQEKLIKAGVPSVAKVFEESTHGFMEGNYPEMPYPADEKQRKLRDECFLYLKERMNIHWDR